MGIDIKNNLDPLTTFRVVTTLFWRGFQVSVLLPATVVASFAATAAATGDNPFRDTASAIYQYADEAIRSAPAGHVFLRECADPAGTSAAPEADQAVRPIPLCKSFAARAVPADDVIAAAAGTLQRVYLILVAVSLCVVFFLYGFGRRLVGLPVPEPLPTLGLVMKAPGGGHGSIPHQ